MESLMITQPSSEYWAYPENYSSTNSTNRGAARSGFEPEVWMKPEPIFRVEDLLDFSQHDEAGEEKEKEEEEERLINSSNSLNNNETNIKNLITEDETCCYNKGLGLLPADELEWLGNFMEDDNSSYYRFLKEEQHGFETLISTEITEAEEEEESITIVHPCQSSRAHMQGRSKARSKRCRSSRLVLHRQLSGNPLVVREESQNSSPPSSSSSAEEETEQVLLTAASCCFTTDSPRFLVVPTPAASLFPSLSSLSSNKKKKKKKKNKNGSANGNSSCRNADRHPRKKTKGVAVASDDGRRCSHCQVTKTPQWRAGPLGPKTLCNACGVRFKSGRLLPEYRPAGSPTFESHLHSNSHRKVLEMRSGKTPRQPALLPQVAEDDRQQEEQEESCLNDSTGSTTTTLCSDDCLIV